MIDIPKKKKVRTLCNRIDWTGLQVLEMANKLVALQIDAKVHGMSVEMIQSIDDFIKNTQELMTQAKKLRGLANDHTILYR